MDPVLRTFDDDLVRGMVVDRPNRFVLEVRFEDAEREVFLPDPGALEVVSYGSTVLCRPVDDDERSTDFDAIAVEVDDIYVSLRASFANELFGAAISNGLLPAFEGYSIEKREPELPEHGRSDFLLEPPDGAEPAFVEIKSCTHAEDGLGKFPDRPTDRGRRHLRSLADLVERGREAHLVFVAQRPDIDTITSYREVDSDFADLLVSVYNHGVKLHGIGTEFQPPRYRLVAPEIPVKLS